MRKERMDMEIGYTWVPVALKQQTKECEFQIGGYEYLTIGAREW